MISCDAIVSHGHFSLNKNTVLQIRILKNSNIEKVFFLFDII